MPGDGFTCVLTSRVWTLDCCAASETIHVLSHIPRVKLSESGHCFALENDAGTNLNKTCQVTRIAKNTNPVAANDTPKYTRLET